MTDKQQSHEPVQRFPDFLCIGAQKAGTTWLHENLKSHPEVWLPPIKELHYFNELYIAGQRQWIPGHRRAKAIEALRRHIRTTPESEWSYPLISCLTDLIQGRSSDEWYGSVFTLAGAHKLCGEFTPEYSILPRAGISHLMRLSPTAKAIVILRDPIDRCWSHIRMLTRDNENMTNEAAWSFEDVRHRSEYMSILSAWRSRIASERLHVTFSDKITNEPLKALREVCNFLNISFSEEYFPRAKEPVFVGPARDLPDGLYREMREYFKPTYQALAADYGDPCSKWRERHRL